MPSVSELLERESRRVDLERGHFERLLHRRDRKRRNQRIGAGGLAIILALVSFVALTRAFTGAERPADESPKPIPTDTALRRDGEVIVFERLGTGPGWDLAAQDPETGEVRTLVDAGVTSRFTGRLIGSAAWSADGRWVAFEVVACGGGIMTEAGTGGVWVTNGLDEPRQLTRPCFEDPDVPTFSEIWAWSPAGAQLVVARTSIDGDTLVLIDPVTGDRTDLGDVVGGVTALTWSPDGTRVAYGTTRGSVYSVGVAGGDHSLLASSLGDVGGVFGSGIRWSPDGAHIVVQADDETSRLYLMNADGSDLHQLAEDVEVQGAYMIPGLSWSPDGTRMAYAASSGGREERQMQIWVESPDGSAPSLLFESAPEPAPAPDVNLDTEGSPVWSPDGARIAFGVVSTDGEAFWLVANADGTGHTSEIDQLRYLSWRGGWYFCQCYG